MPNSALPQSEALKLFDSIDWSKTSLGPIENWPSAMKSSLYSCFASDLPTAIYWGPDFHLFYNDAYTPIAGLKHPTSFGQPGAVAWSEIWEDIKPQFNGVMNSKRGIALKNQMLMMNRFGKPEEAYFDYSLSPVMSDEAVVQGIHNVAIEITEKVVAEKKIAQSAKVARTARVRLADTLENMIDSYFSIDANWLVTDINRAHEMLTGISRENQIGKDLRQLFFKEQTESDAVYVDNYNRLMNDRIPVSFEAHYPPLDLWTLVNAYPNEDGGMSVFFKDISDIKRVQIELEKAQIDLNQAIDIAGVGFWYIDARDGSAHVSSNFLKQCGIEAKDFDGSLDGGLSCVHPDDRARVATLVSEAMKERVDYHTEYRVVQPTGVVRWIEAKGTNIRDAGAVETRFTGTTIDITDRIEGFQALEEAKAEAERANHLKSAFLANMSHEIRTPLGAMIGFADLLRDPGISAAERANYIEILQKNGEQLGHVINDILDLSKVETGHINFEFLKVSPLHIAHEVVSLMAVIAKEKGLALSFHDDGSTPETLVSDPTRIRQVLLNLVGNALKFTKVGSIKITLSGYEGNNGEKCCAFEVSDTGTGIPESAKDRLFKMFSQADNSMTRKYGGTGLGLALSRALARSMGGNVRLVTSEENVGSTFHFSVESREDLLAGLNLQEAQRSTVEPVPLAADALAGVKILLVEDSPDNQQLIWRYLTKYGARVEIADNGSEGVTKALASEHHIVLMDLQMPVMDGYTAVGKLRSKGYRVPILALTAHAMADVKKKCHDVGCNGHLPKPINPRQLVEAIQRFKQDSISHA